MISVVIIDYFSAERTFQYVNEYIKKIHEESTFIIVDNSNSDDNFNKLGYFFRKEKSSIGKEVLLTYQQHDILLLQSPGNIGFARGNNLGAKKAMDFFNPEYILFSNSDIQFPDDFTVAPLIEVLRENQKVVMVGPKIVSLDGKQQSPNRYVPISERYVYHNLLWPLDSKISFLKKYMNIMHDEIKDAPTGYVYQILGAFFMVESQKFKEISMFDENTFLYAEEEILSERASQFGYKVYYVSDITVIHEQGGTTGNLNDSIGKEIKIIKWLLDSEMYYYSKYRGYNKFTIIICRIITNFYLWKRQIMLRIKRGMR